ncbi:hypothetical protein SISSUDRAFT_1056059 [Sistotremastrum suecicum HHB10207 ss-3]|uniref:Uncharacterized protein n=1 Tax=Sistotremastrum suecicum HHB10207 ss-3 TaxID=1314776 RepID=A0A165XB78_9AGAM|nr:hypothetical protein SISSUDRAFT_1056059 [Sistotremastrum suecicum HHB10207 ss-3]
MRHFLDLCVESYNPGHPIWERKQQTSESTRQQAAKLLKKLDGLDAGQSSESVLSTDAAISPQPMKTEAEDQPWPLTLRILHSITQMLRNTWTWKRKTGVHVAVEDPDIEMGSRSCSQA